MTDTDPRAPGGAPGPTAANVRAIVEIERRNHRARSRVQMAIDRIAMAASSVPFIALHAAWFALWIVTNTRTSFRFDPFPFNLLTMIVSLEAILLTAFVLISQNHLTLMADRRALLDLQINLLTERELTATLKAVCLIAEKVGVDIRSCDVNLEELLGRTDVKALSDRVIAEMEERPGDRGVSGGDDGDARRGGAAPGERDAARPTDR